MSTVNFIAAHAPNKDEIKKRYEALMKESDEKIDSEISALLQPYREAKAEAAAKSRVSVKNANEKFAADGLSKSGESVQNELIGSMTLAANEAKLDRGYISDIGKLNAEKATARNELAAEQAEKLYEHDMSIYSDLLKGYESDRSYTLDTQKVKNDYELSGEKLENDYNITLEKLRQAGINDEKARALEAQKLEAEKLKAQRDYEIKLKTLAAAEAQDSFENEIKRQYLELERYKAYNK